MQTLSLEQRAAGLEAEKAHIEAEKARIAQQLDQALHLRLVAASSWQLNTDSPGDKTLRLLANLMSSGQLPPLQVRFSFCLAGLSRHGVCPPRGASRVTTVNTAVSLFCCLMPPSSGLCHMVYVQDGDMLCCWLARLINCLLPLLARPPRYVVPQQC